jgi:hypothetical protein
MMNDKTRDNRVEDRLNRLGVHYHTEDKVLFVDIASDPNPARWVEDRFDKQHVEELGIAICDDRPVPALILYKPPGSTKYRRIGGRHREEAAIGLGLDGWPAYVIDEPLDEFLLEALPIFDNVGMGKDYTKKQRLEFAAHLLAFKDHDPDWLAKWMQVKPAELTQYVDLLAAMNRAQARGIPDDTVRAIPPNVVIEANKIIPSNDAIFKAAVETLAFTEMQGHAAKGLIKDAATARSEAAALARLAEIYAKHKAELERQQKRGRKGRTPTLAQKFKRPVVEIEGRWPGRIELLELTAHENEFIDELEAAANKAANILKEVVERCRQIQAMRVPKAA